MTDLAIASGRRSIRTPKLRLRRAFGTIPVMVCRSSDWMAQRRTARIDACIKRELRMSGLRSAD